jgi:hypothetical protein
MSKITMEEMLKYNYLFGNKIKLKEIADRNRQIASEIDEIRKASRNLKSTNLQEFKEFKVRKKGSTILL